jgi:hypothetical protein
MQTFAPSRRNPIAAAKPLFTSPSGAPQPIAMIVVPTNLPIGTDTAAVSVVLIVRCPVPGSIRP